MVKRSVRGMLPDHRSGRGKDAMERLKCHDGIPKEFEAAEKITFEKGKGTKSIKISEIYS